ncbi:MAG: hypothetical protein K5931_02115 [Lachnospiraceae bacterium]|nr:hypothetical protein [Lachnospiraceae bacterium]
MRNNIKNKLMQFIWEHFHRNKPMIPKGLVDTSALNNQVIASMEELKGLLAKDPHIFRQMQLMSRYRVNFSPDFNETQTACLYESRMCNIYGLEYYLMYSLLLPYLLKENIRKLRILSLGCGSMIDGLSLSLVLKNCRDSIDVQYTGVDIAKWPMSFKLPFENRLILKPMQDYLEDCETFDGNVLIFPTVLSGLREYPDETGTFCQRIEETQFLSDTIFLMVAYRSVASYNRDWQVTDWQKAQRIIAALEKKGYVAEDLPVTIPDAWKDYLQSETVETEEGKKYICRYLSARYGSLQLKEIAPDFAPPDSVEEYFAKPGLVRRSCPYYKMRRDQYLSKNPGIRPDEEIPETVCRQQCPIMCGIYPRMILSKRTSPCFQIFVLRR